MASKGGIGGKPMAPKLSSSPAIATGFLQNQDFRGKSLDEINALLPTFNSWEEAAQYDWSKSPLAKFGPLDDAAITNLLGDLYGLNTIDYKIDHGQVVNAKNFAERNVWWLAPAAIVGAGAIPAIAGAAGGGGAAAAGAGGSGSAGAAGLTLGATYPAMTTAGSALAGGLVPGASGGAAAAGAGSLGANIFKYLLPTAGQIVNGVLQNSAANSASKVEQQYAERAFQAALEEQQYNRKTAEEQRAYDRQQTADQQKRFADYTAKFDPYVQRGNAAGSRLEELLLGGFGRK